MELKKMKLKKMEWKSRSRSRRKQESQNRQPESRHQRQNPKRRSLSRRRPSKPAAHSQETFADSRPGERADTVIGLGDDLQELLEKQYGYEVLHITEAFDMKEGCLERSRAYNYAEPVIAAALEEHPSIQVVIDLHRDGVNGSKRLVTEINGKPTAQIMFFNGLSRTKESGELTSLPNPYQAENLAFSFQMEYEAEQYYPGFSRCIYLKGYRYNLHLRPRSVLLEVGAQTNTVEEVKNAMGPFSDILHKVLSGKSPASGG